MAFFTHTRIETIEQDEAAGTVTAIGQSGFQVSEEQASALIYGYAAGLDMTRRDLQLQSREKNRPWDTGKDVENSAVCSEVVPMQGVVLEQAAIDLTVNGATKQSSHVNLIYTGTPEGVGPVVPGDVLHGRVEGVAEVRLTLGPPQR